MKTPNRILISLRMLAVGTCLLIAAALAVVAVTSTSVATDTSTGPGKQAVRLAKAHAEDIVEQRDEAGLKPAGIVDAAEAGLPDFGPATSAIEETMKRAYPAAEIPFTAQAQAMADMKAFVSAAFAPAATPPPGKKGKKPSKKNKQQPPEPTPTPYPSWNLYGPSTAQMPAILTFAGTPYVTSGRVTALAIDTVCVPGNCRLWVGAAGGGIWRTPDALAVPPSWTFVSGQIQSNAIGALTYDGVHGVLYAGTGEPNASGDSEAGAGVFKSTDGGTTWLPLPGNVGPISTFSPGSNPSSNGTYYGNAFVGRSIGSIVIDPTNPLTIYVSTARGVRGVSSTTGGATSNPPAPRPPFGLFKSTDGGNSFKFIWDGGASCPVLCNGTDPFSSIRGVTDVRLDPSNHNIVYAATFPSPNLIGGGIWRSTDAGTTWTQIHSALNSNDTADRAAFDVANLGGGNTRLITQIGNDGPAFGFSESHIFRSDNAQGAATFTDLTAAEAPANQSNNVCTGQCWYDNWVYIPKGQSTFVYAGGSFDYNNYGGRNDGRGVIGSSDGGNSWRDFTWDANTFPTPVGQCCQPNPISPNGIHPDNHAFVTAPGNPVLWFDGSDGGLVRVDGNYTDISSQCIVPRLVDGAINPADVPTCLQLLGAVPNNIISMNPGLSTLQFQSVSIDPFNPFHLQGGTQDNGTFEGFGGPTWNQEIFGDGGLSGFSRTNSNLRVNTFTGQDNAANFQNGDPSKWVLISAPMLLSPEGAAFYPPLLADPHPSAPQTIFEHSRHVWRTQDWGGNQATLEANCNVFLSSVILPCGDFVPLGGGPDTGSINTAGDLGGTVYGTDRRPSTASRQGSYVARTTSNTGTMWASTAGGRVFVTDNVDNPTQANVIWNRIDPDSGAAPGAPLVASKDPTRFPSAIVIDPNNVHHAWISYSGYDFNTPAQPGHVFSVSWPGAGFATWTNISGNLPKVPVTALARDDFNGDLYAGTDFIVLRLANGSGTWFPAGSGMPFVEITDLKVVPNSRLLYAATHGRAVFILGLP